MLKKKIKGGLPSQLISRRARVAFLGAFVSLLAVSHLDAAAISWIAGTGNFSTGANWSSGTVPTSADTVAVTAGGGNVDFNATANVGALTIGGGSTADVLNINSGTLKSATSYIASSTTGAGVVNMTGGIWNVAGGFLVGSSASSGQTAVLNLSGGTVTLTGTLAIGQGTDFRGAVNLTDSGILMLTNPTLKQIILASVSGSQGVLNIGTGGVAGTLIADRVTSGGSLAVVNFNHTNDVTFNTSIYGLIAVNKLGSGTTTLTAAGTMSLATSINEGAMLMNTTSGSATGSGIVTVAHLAKLGGFGNVGGNIVANGLIAPGALNAIGTLSALQNVTWNGQAADAWTFDLGASGVSDKLAITGALTKGTGTDYVFDFLGGGSVGSYQLLTFGSSTFASSDFSATNLGAGLMATFTKSATDLSVAISATPVPEPATFAALAGAVVLGFVVVRRRKTVAA